MEDAAEDLDQEGDPEEEDNEEEEDEEGDDTRDAAAATSQRHNPPLSSQPKPENDERAPPLSTTDDPLLKPDPGTPQQRPGSATPSHHSSHSISTRDRLRLAPRPEALSAKIYDIVPTMAAPQSTSVNCMAITPDMRFWLTGGSDGYIRKYDGAGTINGKQLLTVAQRHPFVDSVVKCGVLMSYWENEEPTQNQAGGGSARLGSAAGWGGGGGLGGGEDHVLSPVYGLAVHSQALWLLSGLESGGINVHSVRIDEGKRITCLQGHRSAVSVLQLWPDEKSVLSGSWDRRILDWDLNTGQVARGFEENGSQISAIELRPEAGSRIPDEAGEMGYGSGAPGNHTLDGNNGVPMTNGLFIDQSSASTVRPATNGVAAGDEGDGGADAPGSDHESLFGSPAGSLFGDTDTNMGGGGGGAFGNDNDDDDEFGQAMQMTLADESGHNDSSGVGQETLVDGDTSMHDATADGSGGARGNGHERSDVDGHDLPNGVPLVNGQHATAVFALADPPPSPSIPSAPDQQFATESEAPPTLQPPELERQMSAQSHHSQHPQEPASSPPRPAQPSTPQATLYTTPPPPSHNDPTAVSSTTFLSASIDGTLRIWDRRVQHPVAHIATRVGVPPWAMGACWGVDGNSLYVGRRNCTVEEFSIHKARRGWEPERTLRFPGGSGAVSAVRSMVNGRHLVW
jgi:transcriptional activator SPT8